jgi:protein-histidine pros-kinase
VDRFLAEDTGQGDRKLRVLVAEDNAVNQTLVKKLLEKLGHEVVVANNGQEAVERFTEDRFDLILMDVQMPVMSGFEATQTIRAREQRRSFVFSGGWRSTPIIALTAHAMAGDREACLAAGMDDHLGKPVRAKDLYAAIDRVLAAAASGADASGAAVVSETRSSDVLAHLAEIDAAVTAHDRDKLMLAAHSMRDALMDSNALAAIDAAIRVELAARRGDFTAAGRDAKDLRQEMERLAPPQGR